MSILHDISNSDLYKWLEKAIAEKYLKYYEHNEFKNIKEISRGSSGSVYRANWKSSNMVLKYPDNSTIEEFVNEVNYHYLQYNFLFILLTTNCLKYNSYECNVKLIITKILFDFMESQD